MSQIQLDTIDREIITQLIDDGRKSFTDVAQELGVSAGTVRNRLSRLQEQGTLRVVGFLDLDQVGIHAYATVYISVSPSRLIGSVVEQLDALPEVSFMASIAGDYDLHIDIQCLDNAHLTALIQDRIQQIEGVIDTKTVMVLKIHKYGQPDLSALEASASSLTKQSP